MSLADHFITLARRLLPAPFTIAVLLTLATMGLALMLTRPSGPSDAPYFLQVLGFWHQGFWNLLEFAMQMMLMLVLGHVLALTPPVDALIRRLVVLCKTTPKAVAVVTAATVVVALFNWGLGLIFGAILARKVGELAVRHDYPINYPMVGAAGYAGLMVWHGGLSGSAPLKVAEPGHFLVEQIGTIPLSLTTFSAMNIMATLMLLLILPLGMAWIARKVPPTSREEMHRRLGMLSESNTVERSGTRGGAEALDHAPGLAVGFALLILGAAAYQIMQVPDPASLTFLTPNFINFLLLGVGLLLYASIARYMAALEEAIAGATGIMIQFPLYAGIAGIMQFSGLIAVFSAWLIDISTAYSYPLFAFVSAGLVNMFVPSGGGQWAVQGPIVVQAAGELGVSIPKAVMALAYGDQITNMLQPFWALPLLGITRLHAQEILPFTFCLFLMGALIFCGMLLAF